MGASVMRAKPEPTRETDATDANQLYFFAAT
jgi:hypothetical protein